jgi:hypothetical protein
VSAVVVYFTSLLKAEHLNSKCRRPEEGKSSQSTNNNSRDWGIITITKFIAEVFLVSLFSVDSPTRFYVAHYPPPIS